MPFLPLLEMYTATGCLNKKLCWSFETLLFFGSAMMAFPDGTRDGKLFRRIPIFTQCSNRKKMALERLSTFHKSASHVTHSAIALQKRSAYVSHTVQHARTAYSLVRQSLHSAVFYALHAVVRPPPPPHHLHNANVNCALVRCTHGTGISVRLRVVNRWWTGGEPVVNRWWSIARTSAL